MPPTNQCSPTFRLQPRCPPLGFQGTAFLSQHELLPNPIPRAGNDNGQARFPDSRNKRGTARRRTARMEERQGPASGKSGGPRAPGDRASERSGVQEPGKSKIPRPAPSRSQWPEPGSQHQSWAPAASPIPRDADSSPTPPHTAPLRMPTGVPPILLRRPHSPSQHRTDQRLLPSPDP